MKRRAAILAVVLAAATWMVFSNGRSDAFQAQPRTRAIQPGRAAVEPGAAGRPAERRPAASVRPPAAQPAEQPVASAARADGSILVDRGQIMLIDQRTLASDVPGILAEVPFREGDEVPARVMVARLRDDVPAAAYKTTQKLATSDIEERYAEAAFHVAEATVDAAEAANNLVSSAVPLIEVKRLELDAERANLQIDKAVHDREVADLRAGEAKAQLDTYTITAPFEGVITRVHKQVGEAIRQGDPIIELVSTKRVKVEGYVPVGDFWTIQRGNLVRVWIELPGVRHPIEDRVFEGRLIFVDRTVHPVTRMVRVWAEVDNPDDLLRGGLPAQMTIHPDKTYEAPAEAAASAQ